MTAALGQGARRQLPLFVGGLGLFGVSIYAAGPAGVFRAAGAFSIEALSSVAKLATLVVLGSLGVQEGGQVPTFVAFGLGAPLALTFSLLRRGRELLWVGFGLMVLRTTTHCAGCGNRTRGRDKEERAKKKASKCSRQAGRPGGQGRGLRGPAIAGIP